MAGCSTVGEIAQKGVPCPKCEAKGYLTAVTCVKCKGVGSREEFTMVKMTLVPGVPHGHKLDIPNRRPPRQARLPVSTTAHPVALGQSHGGVVSERGRGSSDSAEG
jgi:RecJ-like exonuclease